MRTSRGFTLIELMLIVAILGGLVAMAGASLSGSKNRTNFTAGAQSLAVTFRQARAEAMSRGSQVSLVFDSQSLRWWMIDDPASALNMSAFNPASPVSGSQALVDSGTLSSPVAYSDAGFIDGGAAAGLPQPFSTVPVATNMTFCATGQRYCAVTFANTGGASFSSGSTAGGSLTLSDLTYPTNQHQVTYAVVARTGLVETFEVGP